MKSRERIRSKPYLSRKVGCLSNYPFKVLLVSDVVEARARPQTTLQTLHHVMGVEAFQA